MTRGYYDRDVHEIAEFLRRHAPFDALSEEEADALAASVEIEFFAAGATIRPQDGSPGASVRVVRTGAVELVARDTVLDLLGEGDLFGHASMLSGLPSEFAARAHEDTLVYRIPAEAAEPVLARPSGVRYVARSLVEWQERAVRAGGARGRPRRAARRDAPAPCAGRRLAGHADPRGRTAHDRRRRHRPPSCSSATASAS